MCLARTDFRYRRLLSLVAAYGVAVGSVALAGLFAMYFASLIAPNVFALFTAAVMISAFIGGLRAGLLATVLATIASIPFLLSPYTSLAVAELGFFIRLSLFTGTAILISSLTEARRHAEMKAQRERDRFAVTLNSIGDAVIATDLDGRITFLNPAAEVLTGWSMAAAVGQPFETVFRIVNEQSRLPIESPITRVLREGAVVKLDSCTLLLAKDGKEYPIEDCGSPIRYSGGRLHGAVLVFQDVSARKQAESERVALLERERAARTAAEAAATALQRIQSVTDAALAHLTLDDLLRELLGRIRVLLTADTATILLLDHHTGMLVVRATEGLEEEGAQRVTIPLGAGFAGWIAENRRPRILPDVTPANVINPILLRHGIRSLLGVPLLVEGQCIGVVHVGTVVPRAFTSDDASLLQLVADRAALAIAHARWYEAEQRSVYRLNILHEIDRAILAAHSSRDIATTALAGMQRVIPYQHGQVILRGDHGTFLLLAHCCATEGWETEVIATATGTYRTVERSAEQIVDDLASIHPRPSAIDCLLQHGIRSLLCVPFQPDGLQEGWIALYAAQSAIFNVEHGQIAGEIASQLAIALQQSHFRDELRQHAEELERRVEERTAELQAIVDDLNVFTYIISHDLRAPLRALQGFSTAVLEDYAESLPSQGQTYLQHISSAAEHMDRLIQDLLAYNRLRRANLQLKPVDLTAVVTAALEQVHENGQKQDAQITIGTPLPKVIGHYATLVQVIANLLSNAIKFVSPGKSPQIRIAAEERQRCVRLTIEDQGIGIEPQDQQRIFQVFERLHGGEHYPGTGMGLAIVLKGVERMGGQVGVESQIGQGSRFWIELPSGASP